MLSKYIFGHICPCRKVVSVCTLEEIARVLCALTLPIMCVRPPGIQQALHGRGVACSCFAQHFHLFGRAQPQLPNFRKGINNPMGPAGTCFSIRCMARGWFPQQELELLQNGELQEHVMTANTAELGDVPCPQALFWAYSNSFFPCSCREVTLNGIFHSQSQMKDRAVATKKPLSLQEDK